MQNPSYTYFRIKMKSQNVDRQKRETMSVTLAMLGMFLKAFR